MRFSVNEVIGEFTELKLSIYMYDVFHHIDFTKIASLLF